MADNLAYRFHVSVHPRPVGVVPRRTTRIGDAEIPILGVDSHHTDERFAVSFEQAAAELARLDRMFIEPDGSFVWVSGRDEPPWQIDGNLLDRDDRLLFVDLKGNCPREDFDRLLAALGWPDTPLMFQLVRQAVFVDEETFRNCAALAAANAAANR